MAVTQHKEGKKWINASVAIAAILLGYVFLSFFEQLNEWFELEAKIGQYTYVAQGVAVIIGLIAFIMVNRHPQSSSFLKETYGEMVKVVWPDKSETSRHTVGIIIGVTIAGFLFGFFDYIASFGLGLIQ